MQAVLDRYATDGVQFHALRTRQAGARRFVSVHVLVPGQWTVQRGHHLLERIEADVRQALPGVTVFTHLESLDDPASWDDVALDRTALGRSQLAQALARLQRSRILVVVQQHQRQKPEWSPTLSPLDRPPLAAGTIRGPLMLSLPALPSDKDQSLTVALSPLLAEYEASSPSCHGRATAGGRGGANTRRFRKRWTRGSRGRCGRGASSSSTRIRPRRSRTRSRDATR